MIKINTLALLSFSLCFFHSSLKAQIGNNIFGQEQVVDIHLNSTNPNFWSTLVTNYETTGDYAPADFTITDFTGTTVLSDVGVKIKGTTSYNHPGNKKAFKLDFNEFVTGQNYDGLKKLNLHNSFNDPTHMREKLFFDVCNAAGAPAPKTSFANVYINGTLWGFYTLVEQVDNQFLENNFIDIEGNLFKSGDNVLPEEAPADLVYYGTNQTSYENRYELKSNEAVNDWTDLIQFIDFVNNSTSITLEYGLLNEIDLPEYMRSLALDNLFSNLASYTGTAENYYLYNDGASGRWHWIKWDGNEAFGLFNNGLDNALNIPLNYVDALERPLIENIFSNAKLYNQYQGQVCHLLDNYFNVNSMNTRIDELKALIEADVYADTNKQFSNSDFDTNIESDLAVEGGLTVYGLKSFVAEKVLFLSGQIDCANCSYDIAGASGCTYPDSYNYDSNAVVDDGSCISFCPGDFNGDAIVTAADLTTFLAVFGDVCN